MIVGKTCQDSFNLCCNLSARLEQYGIARNDIKKAYIRAGSDPALFLNEVLCSGVASEVVLYGVVADYLNLPFRDRVTSCRVIDDKSRVPAELSGMQHALVLDAQNNVLLYLSPSMEHIIALKIFLSTNLSLNFEIVICSPSVIQLLDRRSKKHELARKAVTVTPAKFSSRRVLDTRQAFVIAFSISLLAFLFFNFLWPTLFAFHIFLSCFFFTCVGIRLLAAMSAQRLPKLKQTLPLPSDLPNYTVLVPLYKESDVIPQLLEALSNLHWPRGRLDIKIICEADDRETLQVLGYFKLPPFMEVVRVPNVGPRTKPKALNYALQFARGEFVAVFDAEDRPHPLQLLDAWVAFQKGGEQLACVQAPLIIGNFRNSFLTRLFSFEYTGLFRGLLPWMARHDLVMPLGGTSNHMRRSALEKVGGWDAYNVTEDADLGVRLARFGYSIKTISHGTIEDAPENFPDWYKQRTRWMKGWMQTSLVHLRNPVETSRQLGFKRFIISQVYMLGLIISALFHPLMLLTMIFLVVSAFFTPFEVRHMMLLTIDMMNIVMAYVSYYLLAAKAAEKSEMDGYPYLLGIVPYWIMISFSTWRALLQLMKEPFLWEKTPHFRSATATQALGRHGLHQDNTYLEDAKNAVPAPMILVSSAPIASRSRPS
ncbi:cellulose synthase/poly-beta-1,6-N-acetylglucosamine synthase-like glycosyltransferase [Paenochrobactrum gallinarii]|uniref:Cellulose synthase/poly-beta-1,6-N-acetylglucosamine synthase-like glycosyltransferase n=1 Tax=Paenochrobactrum gallinarii TaxID=643673 RepID=A0A841LUH8_9HYPH|nr:glycosyltransferase [Paenochrobactrum gallinarii]MBB6260540.1 cellulose synthase/poly-beta-1,6-N-acetylglucosamine synthase-like glycosyltransferase [Paenochrobactrum gallinarii]